MRHHLNIALILAPSNLGLRPLYPGHVPGTWRAPDALCEAGLVEALAPGFFEQLARPVYDPEPQPGTRIRNGNSLRAYNLEVARVVDDAAGRGHFPVVIGGDCSILLGALAGARTSGPLSLIHIDGHSDFRHPGNFDFEHALGAAAGMDLALVTGRGESLLTQWPGIDGPLVADEQVVQIGERESGDEDFAWPDIGDTPIHRFDIFEILHLDGNDIAQMALGALPGGSEGIWVHVDLDVIDEEFLPAVDCPGSPGLSFLQLQALLRDLISCGRCSGLTVTIYDPDKDADLQFASRIVDMLAAAFGRPPIGRQR